MAKQSRRNVAFCSCAPHFTGPRRVRATCSAGGDEGKRPVVSRRAALNGLGALAITLAVTVLPHDVAANTGGPDHEELAKYPALEIGHEILVPEWTEPDMSQFKPEGHEGELGRFEQRRESRWEKPEAEAHYSWGEWWQVGNGLSMAEDMQILLTRIGVAGSVAAFTLYGTSMSDRLSGRVQLPEKYDPKLVARYYNIRPDRVVARVVQLAVEAARFGLLRARYYVDELVSNDSLTERQRFELAARRRTDSADSLCASITRLGPAFIKIAQAASMRPDVIGSELARKLQSLQNNVTTPFPIEDALALIRSELGARPTAVFDRFDVQPVAGASLGMVFRASIDGKPVAVKLQRPGVAESIALDFYIVRSIVGVGQRLFGYRSDIVRAVDEYASRMFEELDYRVEVKNMTKFKKIYDGFSNVIVPSPFARYTAKKVLISEFVIGNKIIDENCEVKVSELGVVETGIKFALTQLLDKGFLHADMHNGNMLTNANGDLVLIDFGIVTEIPEKVREAMVLALFYLIHGEYKMLAETCVDLALFPPHALEDELPQFTAALEKAFSISDMPMHLALTCDPNSPVVCRFSLMGVSEKLLTLGGRFPLVFNSYFLNSLRCLGMLEGLALSADPYFSVLDVVYPFIMSKILSGGRGTAYRAALERVLLSPRGAFKWDKLNGMLLEVRRAESGGIVRKPMKAVEVREPEVKEPLDELLLSPKGGFLRRQLVNEWGMQGGSLGRSKVSDVFRRASLAGKLRALAMFLPAIILRAFIVMVAAIWHVLRSLFRRQRTKSLDRDEVAIA